MGADLFHLEMFHATALRQLAFLNHDNTFTSKKSKTETNVDKYVAFFVFFVFLPDLLNHGDMLSFCVRNA